MQTVDGYRNVRQRLQNAFKCAPADSCQVNIWVISARTWIKENKTLFEFVSRWKVVSETNPQTCLCHWRDIILLNCTKVQSHAHSPRFEAFTLAICKWFEFNRASHNKDSKWIAQCLRQCKYNREAGSIIVLTYPHTSCFIGLCVVRTRNYTSHITKWPYIMYKVIFLSRLQ